VRPCAGDIMKKSSVFLLSGAALFAAGYFVRGLVRQPGAAPEKNGPVAAALQEPAAGERATTGTERAVLADSFVRPFTPGRPFAPGHARDWLLSLTAGMGGDRRGNAIAMVTNLQRFMTMDEASVREALTALEELIVIEDAKNPSRRRNPNGDGVLDNLLELSMMRMVQINPGEALAMLKKNFSLNDGTTRLLVLGMLTGNDPQRAEQLVLSMEKDQQKDALESVMYALINRDPEAALAFASRHPETNDEKYRERILESWVKRDPKAAMAAAVQDAVTSNNPELIRNTIEEWCKSDPAAATQWANAHEGAGHVTARAMVLERRAREEPEAVLQEHTALLRAGGDPRELGRLTGALADSLAGKDVNTARAWAESLPEGELRYRALHEVTEEWVRRDAPAASEWIRALPSGELRDDAARELTSAIAGRDPAGAFEWARSIGNTKIRESALTGVMRIWREVDPEAARAALDALPAEVRPQ
jgi:hypothetical protein